MDGESRAPSRRNVPSITGEGQGFYGTRFFEEESRIPLIVDTPPIEDLNLLVVRGCQNTLHAGGPGQGVDGCSLVNVGQQGLVHTRGEEVNVSFGCSDRNAIVIPRDSQGSSTDFPTD
jgi:hypothetical protein